MRECLDFVANRLQQCLVEQSTDNFNVFVRKITNRAILLQFARDARLISTRDASDWIAFLCSESCSPGLEVRARRALPDTLLRLSRLLDDIVDFTTVECDQLQLAFEPFIWKRQFIDRGAVQWVSAAAHRKSTGAFYTPRFIADYIVDGVLTGPCDAPRVLDPSCGSGRFLLAAFDCLLDRHVANHGTADLSAAFEYLKTCIHGVDIDLYAVEVARTVLMYRAMRWSAETASATPPTSDLLSHVLSSFENIAHANLLTNRALGEPVDASDRYPWLGEPFDAVIGNPPYRRERDSKLLMDEIAITPLGQRFRTARMDLWYYFVHRAHELLRPGGLVSFIVNSYWMAGTGAEKLIQQFRSELHLQEILEFGSLKIFQGVNGRHLVFLARKTNDIGATSIRRPTPPFDTSARAFVEHVDSADESLKTVDELFGGVSKFPSIDRACHEHMELGRLGRIRQGIAENPASINRRTNHRFDHQWEIGQGVFVLSQVELDALHLDDHERSLVRPYHQLRDLGRYFLAAECSHYLIYSTKHTCPDITQFPKLQRHLSRFREITAARRETRNGSNAWWHLHWPRDESLWIAPKLISIQMGARPGFVVARTPVYTSFSTNVFLPSDCDEDLDYIAAVMNSETLRHWFKHHAKRRGVGLDISGGILAKAPLRRIDFSSSEDTALHNQLAAAARRLAKLTNRISQLELPDDDRLCVERARLEEQIDAAVRRLYDRGLAT